MCDRRVHDHAKAPIVLTYATHAGGTFRQMQADAERYGIDLTVLGWGEPWTGYFGKLRCVRDKVAQEARRDPHRIIVVLDAFDTEIVGPIDRLMQAWEAHAPHADLLFSLSTAFIVDGVLSQYFLQRCFGGSKLNAGMYMGRAWAVKRLLDAAEEIERDCRSDDQRAFNAVVVMDPTLRVAYDEDRAAFYNVEYVDRSAPLDYDAPFRSHPGTLSLERIVRFPGEYWGWFWREVVVIIVAAVAVVLMFKETRKSVVEEAR